MDKYLQLIRPTQWVKNLFVLLPLFFGGRLLEVESLTQALVAFVAFCLVSSSIYCLNDICDVREDRLHPEKCKRPIASGAVPIAGGYALMVGLLLLSVLTVVLFGGTARWPMLGIILFYFVMNVGYCLKLKRVAIVDVFIIAAGFVLRILIGGISTGIVLSQWIVLMTFLLSLFLAFAKRRDDVRIKQNTGAVTRKNVSRYNLPFLNQVLSIVGGITVVCYILYCVSDEVTSRLGSHYVYLTSIFVLAGIIRYLQLALVNEETGNPVKILLKDHFIQLSILGWIVSFALIIYF